MGLAFGGSESELLATAWDGSFLLCQIVRRHGSSNLQHFRLHSRQLEEDESFP